MRRARELFHIEERTAVSRFVDRIWRAQSVPARTFISVAASHWEIVIWRHAGTTHVTARGPETRATAMPIPEDAEFVGIRFKLGVFMPDLSLPALVDRAVPIASGDGHSLQLGGRQWEIPSYDNMDVFLGRLAQAGLLVADPIVATIMGNSPPDLSRRSVERRVRRATGLTAGAIRQIAKAHEATALLDAGARISDAVAAAGYADQAHLTRSLKRFIGQTPGRIVGEAR
jgi:hypothetical protein